MKALLFLALITTSFGVRAHEGHGPKQTVAPNGGIIRDGKALMVELVQVSAGVKIYFITHEAKSISLDAIQIELKDIQLTNAKSKAVDFELLKEGDSLTLKFNKAKSYRYNLILPVSYQNKKDEFKWAFEPQSN